MTKIQFLLALNERLAGLPRNEVEERLNFYTEMIEDRMEEGVSEEEAVAAVGNIEDIAAQITDDIPLFKIAKEKIKPDRQLETWEIVLLVAGFPIWFPLAVALVSVVFSLYVVLWSGIVSLWAVFGAVAGCAVGGIAGGIILACVGNIVPGLGLLGGGCVCAGVAIFLMLGCKAATKGVVLLTKLISLGLKKAFTKKEVTQ
ncbi:MAG: DUF1700 domain-containing protein [Ruminococcaceae bacterium]|nr:DUF1700 domain-containing protein [Oscillospiraceae bacterium]